MKTDFLTNDAQTSLSAVAIVIRTYFNAFAETPFVMDFDVVADFDPVYTVPRVWEVRNVMAATSFDYEDYIDYYVWDGPHDDIFLDVNSVVYFPQYSLS